MFKLLSEVMLEIHESQRWFAMTCLSLINTLCIKLMRKLEK